MPTPKGHNRRTSEKQSLKKDASKAGVKSTKTGSKTEQAKRS